MDHTVPPMKVSGQPKDFDLLSPLDLTISLQETWGKEEQVNWNQEEVISQIQDVNILQDTRPSFSNKSVAGG